MQTAKFILGVLLAFAGCVVSAYMPLGLVIGIPISLIGTVFIASSDKEPLVRYITIGIPAAILLLEAVLFLFAEKILAILNRLGILS